MADCIAIITAAANKWNLRNKPEFIQSKVYWDLKTQGYNVCCLNERYIMMDGRSFQFRRNRKENRWTVREF
jgi:hypothetical protein